MQRDKKCQKVTKRKKKANRICGWLSTCVGLRSEENNLTKALDEVKNFRNVSLDQSERRLHVQEFGQEFLQAHEK